jgi:hypothetical protein
MKASPATNSRMPLGRIVRRRASSVDRGAEGASFHPPSPRVKQLRASQAPGRIGAGQRPSGRPSEGRPGLSHCLARGGYFRRSRFRSSVHGHNFSPSTVSGFLSVHTVDTPSSGMDRILTGLADSSPRLYRSVDRIAARTAGLDGIAVRSTKRCQNPSVCAISRPSSVAPPLRVITVTLGSGKSYQVLLYND